MPRVRLKMLLSQVSSDSTKGGKADPKDQDEDQDSADVETKGARWHGP